MAFKLIGCAGGLTEVAMLEVLGSGRVQIGDLVERGAGIATKATTGSTTTILLGVAASAVGATVNGYFKVIPIMPGQLWEVDCTSTTTTAQLQLVHKLTDQATIANDTTEYATSLLGVFLAHYIGGGSTTKLIGEFVRVTGFVS
mgnify:CR=1 FL=1